MVMFDPTTAQNDRLRDTGRWGYAGDYIEDPVPVESSSGMGRWLLWVALIAIAVIVLVALFGGAV
jgi:hypothetical protein